jgi:hypothetical protein
MQLYPEKTNLSAALRILQKKSKKIFEKALYKEKKL